MGSHGILSQCSYEFDTIFEVVQVTHINEIYETRHYAYQRQRIVWSS